MEPYRQAVHLHRSGMVRKGFRITDMDSIKYIVDGACIFETCYQHNLPEKERIDFEAHELSKKDWIVISIDEEKQRKPMDRRQLAEHVGKLISADRNATHGDPHDQFGTAQEFKRLFNSRNQGSLPTTCQEAAETIMTKLSRIANGQNIQDHWIDIAGYALIAAEKAEKPL